MTSSRICNGIFQVNSCLLAVLITLFGASQLANAQGIITGGISGTAVDQTGAVVGSATVQAVSETTGTTLEAKTNGAGQFQFSAVPLGAYTVTITAGGFSPVTVSHVNVVAGNVTDVGTQALKLGSATMMVEVNEGAAQLLNVESSQVETTIERGQVASAPVAGSLDNLALVSPGVVNTHADANSNTNGINFSVNGQRGRSNNSEIDGQTNNDTSIGGPSFFFSNQDAIEEVQVLTTSMGAQYGRNMGGIVNYITKSGSNQFHGTGFEIYGGSWLSSLTPAQKAPQYGWCTASITTNCSPTTVPKFVQNNWGGTLGGPIWKDKIWGFGSTIFSHTYEGGQTLTSQGGLFPDSTGISTLKSAFPNNPAVAGIVANGPYSTNVGNPRTVPGTTPQLISVTDGTTVASVEVSQFARTFPDIVLDQEDLGRVDYQFSSKDRIYVRYNYQNNPYNPAFYLTAPNVAAAGAYPNVHGVSHETGGDWTHVFSSSITNQLRYAFQQSVIAFEGGSIPSCTISDQATCSSFVSMGGSLASYGYGFASEFPQGRVIKVNQFQDNATMIKGRHTVSFGGEFDAQHSPWGWLPNDEGNFNFAPGAAVNAANPNGIPFRYPAGGCGAAGASCNNGLTGFLEGVGQLTLSEGNPTIPFKENDFSLYFQDDWKVRQGLTLNLGLRYEFFGQAINFLHNETVARQTGSNPFWNTSLPLSATTIPHLPSDLRNIEPRIGFAYQPSFAQKMVVHGGFSMNADPEFYSMFVNLATAAPAVNAGSIACDGVTVTCVPSGGLTYATVQAAASKYIPTGGDPRLNPTQMVTSNFHNPQGQTYTLGVQYQAFPAVVADVRYVGNHTYGNFQAFNSNPDILAVQSAFPNYGAGISVCTDATAIGYGRPNCDYGAVETYGNTAFSIYNALQASLTMRNYHGFSGIVSYAWSRTVDNTDDFSIGINNNGGGGQASPIAQNPLDTNIGERGISGNTYPNILGFQLTYATPWFKNQSGILGRLLGGYSFNAFYQYNGGQPYNPLQTATTVQSAAVLHDIAGTGSIPPGVAAQIDPIEAGQGFCDLGFAAAGFATGCRPVLSNPRAPMGSVGINLGPGGYVDYVTGATTTPSAEHWLWNNQYQAIAAGNPFPGVGRNVLRGDSWNDLDLSASKTFRVAERVNLQIMASAFNTFNRAYYATPDLNIEHSLNSPSTFESYLFTSTQQAGQSYGAYPLGLGNRNVQLTAKIIF